MFVIISPLKFKVLYLKKLEFPSPKDDFYQVLLIFPSGSGEVSLNFNSFFSHSDLTCEDPG
jgi:hypothetical protein